jgi:hypothetical protein
MGREDVMPSEERYKAAHEYMDLVYQLVVFSHDQCNADMDHSKNVGKRLGG